MSLVRNLRLNVAVPNNYEETAKFIRRFPSCKFKEGRT